MTDRTELLALASALGAAVTYDAGRVSRIRWQGRSYGDGALLSLVCFAESARRELAAA